MKIILKWKSTEGDLRRFRLSCLLPLVLLHPKLLSYLGFYSYEFERTWWRVFWVYLMKVILSVPDEGYSERTWWRLFWAYLMKGILSVPDEGYSRNVSCTLNLISTFLFHLKCFTMNKSSFRAYKLMSQMVQLSEEFINKRTFLPMNVKVLYVGKWKWIEHNFSQ